MSNGLNVYNTLSFSKFCPLTHNFGSRSIESDQSFSELRIKKSFNLSWFVTEPGTPERFSDRWGYASAQGAGCPGCPENFEI